MRLTHLNKRNYKIKEHQFLTFMPAMTASFAVPLETAPLSLRDGTTGAAHRAAAQSLWDGVPNEVEAIPTYVHSLTDYFRVAEKKFSAVS